MPPRWSYRIARRTSVARSALLVSFGVVVIITAATTGQPAGASFVLFGLGLLPAAVGHAMLGFAIRGSGELGRRWALLPVASLGALVAITVFADPGTTSACSLSPRRGQFWASSS